MKKHIALILALCLLLTGCGKKNGSEKTDSDGGNVSASRSSQKTDGAKEISTDPFADLTAENASELCLFCQSEPTDETIGLVNKTNGVQLLPPEYSSEIRNFIDEGIWIFYGDGKLAVIDFNSREIRQLDYEYKQSLDSFVGNGYICVSKNGLYGVIDYEGNEILPCESEFPYSYYDDDGVRIVASDVRENRLTDKDGNTLIDGDYSYFSANCGLFMCKKEFRSDDTDVYDSDYNFVKTVTGSIGKSAVDGYYSYTEENGGKVHHALLNSKLEETVKAYNTRILAANKDFIYADGAIYNAGGDLLYENAADSGSAFFAEKDGETTVFNADGEKLFSGKYENYSADGDLIAVYAEDGWHIYGTDGGELTETPIKESPSQISFWGDCIFAGNSVYTLDGKQVLDLSDEKFKDYNCFEGMYHGGLYGISNLSDKSALVDGSGNIVVEGDYWSLCSEIGGFIIAERNVDSIGENWEYVDVYNTDGKLLVSCESARSCLDGKAEITAYNAEKDDWEVYLINTEGERLDEDPKDAVMQAEEFNEYKTAIAVKNERYLLIDENENVLCEYGYLYEIS